MQSPSAILHVLNIIRSFHFALVVQTEEQTPDRCIRVFLRNRRGSMESSHCQRRRQAAYQISFLGWIFSDPRCVGHAAMDLEEVFSSSGKCPIIRSNEGEEWLCCERIVDPREPECAPVSNVLDWKSESKPRGLRGVNTETYPGWLVRRPGQNFYIPVGKFWRAETHYICF
jgi:hypothetical protein